jgi:hypothetical protein
VNRIISLLAASAAACAAFTTPVLAAGPAASATARPSWLPADATEMSDCVGALGYVYWNPKRLPFGPTYGVYDGKPIFEEIMISRADFERGTNFEDAGKPVPPFPVDHVDIWFAPHGHDGFTQPHYDVLLFFVPHVEHMHLCGNTSGKPPDFVLQDR